MARRCASTCSLCSNATDYWTESYSSAQGVLAGARQGSARPGSETLSARRKRARWGRGGHPRLPWIARAGRPAGRRGRCPTSPPLCDRGARRRPGLSSRPHNKNDKFHVESARGTYASASSRSVVDHKAIAIRRAAGRGRGATAAPDQSLRPHVDHATAGLGSRVHATRRRRPDSRTRGERGVVSCEPPRLVRLPAGFRTPLRKAVFWARLTDETDDPNATLTEIVHPPQNVATFLPTFDGLLPFPATLHA